MSKTGYSTTVVKQNEVVVNLTTKCNNRCLNCSNDDSFLNSYMDEGEVEDFIEKNVKEDTERVAFIGGEPTIANNFFKSIEQVRRLNSKAIIQINSNGRLFSSNDFVKRLVKYGKNTFDVHIALYGADAETHEGLTSVSGSFRQTIKGIMNLLNNGISVQLRTVVSKQNYKELPRLVKLVVEKFKGKIVKFNFVGMDIIGNAQKNKELLVVSHSQIAPYIEKAVAVFRQNKVPCEIHLLPKGIFKKAYHKYAIKSGCVDGAFTKSYACDECSYYYKCPGLLKSYVQIFGNKEHEPVYIS